ncbi:LacI family transcriptional regulator [Streptacidiphilus sp. MAP12-20]|uniref:LacI family DNA-binding transcriptional regulator n=1 Tax=Streptacidiphilus sp. MAP12-20 TaxID=3156299 RepID=UPI0035114FA1
MPDPTSPLPLGRPATVRDVAQRAEVSTATVSRVLTGNKPVTPEIRRRVQQAMKELDYVVNEQARALTVNTSRTVAILLANLTWPFHNRVAHGIEQEAVAQNLACLVATTMGDPEREMAQVELLRARNTDAIVLIGGVVDTPEYRERITHLARSLDAKGSRLVLCGRPAPAPDLPVTVVDYDNEGGAYAATSHLLSLGHRRIAFLGGMPGHTTVEARLTGYRRAHHDYHVEVDPALVLTQQPLGQTNRGFARETIHAMTLAAAGGPLPFTALFCFDDITAAGAVSALRDAAVDVPRDVSVIGFNDEPTALDVFPQLSTVHVPHVELGRTALRLALGRNDLMNRDTGQHVVLGTHLVMRHSVAPLLPDRRT